METENSTNRTVISIQNDRVILDFEYYNDFIQGKADAEKVIIDIVEYLNLKGIQVNLISGEIGKLLIVIKGKLVAVGLI